MFAEWTVHLHRFAERVLFQQPAVYVAGHALQTNLRERNFPDRKVRRRVPPEDLDEHQRAIRALLQRATIGWHVFIGKNPGEIWSYFHRFVISLNLFLFPRVLDPERLFVSGVSDLCPLNPVFMSPGALFISLSPIFISQSSLLSCWSASSSLLAALNSWCISMHALFGLLRSLRCLFPCILVVSCAPYLFLASFIYIRKFMIYFPEPLLLLSVFSILIFPNSFLSHIPGLLSRFWISLHISLNFVGSFISLFISIGSFFICLFLWILICFSEPEPLVFSSLAKTHQVVKLKRRPQWWQNAFVGYVNWREALKHIH